MREAVYHSLPKAINDALSEGPIPAGQRDVHAYPQVPEIVPICSLDAQVLQIQPEPEQTDIDQLKIGQ